MPVVKQTVVYGRGGLKGLIEPGAAERLGLSDRVVIRFDDGRRATVPIGLLAERPGEGFDLPLGASDLEFLGDGQAGCAVGSAAGQALVVPVVAENLRVEKRVVDTGGVRVRKQVVEREQVVDEPLWREQVDVERVPVDRAVEAIPEIRQEGETTVIPVVEEVLVIEKRLMLREELRVTRRRTQERRPQTVPLRAEEVTVERLPARGADPERGSSRETATE